MSIFSEHRNKMEAFKKAIIDKPKEEIREAELKYLTPEEFKKYVGKTPKYRSELASRTAIIVFRDKNQQNLISEVFSVRESIGDKIYITDISLLEAIARGVKEGKYQIVNDEIQLVTGPKESKHRHENEEGTIKVHLPEPTFKTLSDEEEQSLKKKQRKKYRKILDKWDVEAMNKFRTKHFPMTKKVRTRRKL